MPVSALILRCQSHFGKWRVWGTKSQSSQVVLVHSCQCSQIWRSQTPFATGHKYRDYQHAIESFTSLPQCELPQSPGAVWTGGWAWALIHCPILSPSLINHKVSVDVQHERKGVLPPPPPIPRWRRRYVQIPDQKCTPPPPRPGWRRRYVQTMHAERYRPCIATRTTPHTLTRHVHILGMSVWSM